LSALLLSDEEEEEYESLETSGLLTPNELPLPSEEKDELDEEAGTTLPNEEEECTVGAE
jgi:hypothetical protein